MIPARSRWLDRVGPSRPLLAACGVALLQLGSSGCKTSSRIPSPFVFNSPGDMALVCFDKEAARDETVVLPTHCCATEADVEGCPKELDNRLRHALVTQTARGEVAAVDLDGAKVLDSERRVPGYTFVDVGGLPAAIVAPNTYPGRPELGPPWTYVAGREVSSIRAIATCRFRLGEECGPEISEEIEAAKESGLDLRDVTEVPLPEAPQDMVLDPEGTALWVSLPKAGLIARIDLGQAEESGEPPFVAPFATEEGSLTPRAPVYFTLPGGIDLAPAEPEVVEADDEYRSTCGTGYAFASSPQTLPRASRAASTQRAVPTRLRLLPPLPEADKFPFKPEPVLFVADTGQAVLHVLEIVGGELQERGVLPVGAPLRDFVITAPVPSKTPDFDALVHPDVFAYETPAPDDQRYLFGIDGRDGSVMPFELSFSGATPSLTPLVAPVPFRQEVDLSRNVRDRLMFEGASARALEIIDTRYRAQAEWRVADDVTRESRDVLYCGKTPVDALDDAIDEASKTNKQTLEDVKEWTELGQRADVLRGVFLVVAASDGRLTIIDVHDLDLQCRARAGCAAEDNPDGTKPSDDSSAAALALRRLARRVLTAEPAEPLVTGTDKLVAITPQQDDESEDPTCPEGHYPANDSDQSPICCPDGYYLPPDQDNPVCMTSDPWQARNLTWSVIYEGAIANVPNALLEREAGAEQVTLVAPQGLNFCARGANAADQLKVAIVTPPDPDARDCQTYSYGSEPPLFVIEAREDRLVLAPRQPEEDAGGEPPPPEEDGGVPSEGGVEDLDAGMDADEPEAGEPDLDAGEEADPDAEAGADADGEAGADAEVATREWNLDELMRCYPGFLNAEIRLHDQYQVVHTSGVYLHRNHADDAGVCVANEELDPRLTSRVSGPDWEFKDLSLAFKLDVSGDREEVAPIMQLTAQSSFLGILNVDTSSGRADALPSRVRFFPGTEDLFVVDGASQGLRRYTLEPFQYDGKRFR